MRLLTDLEGGFKAEAEKTGRELLLRMEALRRKCPTAMMPGAGRFLHLLF